MSANIIRIQELEELLRYHSDKYFNGEGEITDLEFDTLVEELKQLDPNSQVLSEIGSGPSFGKKAKHSIPMGSLDKITFQKDDKGNVIGDGMLHLNKWYKEHPEETRWSDKVDAASLELVYKNGKLVEASTRGDGCIEYSAMLEFEDGRRIPIGKVCEKEIVGKVKCYNKETGKVEFKEIKSHGIKVNEADWFELEVTDQDNNVKKLTLTGDHQVFVNGKFIKLSDVKEGDKVTIIT